MMLSYRETWLHRVNPSVKLLVLSGLLLALLMVHNPNVMLYLTLAGLVLYLLYTGHPWKRLLLLSLPFVLIFVSTSLTMILFGEGETTWFRFGHIHITAESFYRGVHIGLRSVNFALYGLLFTLTTRPVLLFYSLMQQLRLPPKYAYSFLAAVRLLPIMWEELQTLRHALKVRGMVERKGIGGWYERLKRYAIPLLAQSIRRAHRIAVAMEAKRFTSQNGRTYYYRVRVTLVDGLFVLILFLAWVGSYALGQSWPYLPVTDVR